MTSIADIVREMESIAPLHLAEEWDNVGLLVGDPTGNASRVMTCLTVSEMTVREAIREKADLIISHHPIPFRPLNRIVSTDPTGNHLWRLIRAGVGIYSPHTAWDNALRGINQRLAEMLDLQEIGSLIPNPKFVEDGFVLGSGRVGIFKEPMPIESIFDLLRKKLSHVRARLAGDATSSVKKLGIVCGSGASLLTQVANLGCDGMLTGEATYHDCLKAEQLGVKLLMVGHHASERFAMDRLSEMLIERCPGIHIWASLDETDPVHLA